MERNGNSKPNILLDDTTVGIIKHVAGIAWKMAEQAMPNLWPKLHGDLKCSESLPDALAKLLKRRLYEEAYHYVMTIEILRMKQVYLQDTQLSRIADFLHRTSRTWTIVAGLDTPLVRRVYTIFLRQLEEYRKKYKEDMSQTIVKAIKKDTRSICRLLEWDKSWIEFDFVHNEISARGYHYCTNSDKLFLEMVGDAIRKKPHVKKYTEESGFLTAIAFLANRFSLSGNNNELLKKLHSRLARKDAFDSGTEEEGDPLADFRYFTRYLKRHNIL